MTLEPKEAKLIKHIDVSASGMNCRMRMGDLTGDGRLDFVLVQPDTGFDTRYFPHSVLAATAYSTDGEIMWQIGKPAYEDFETSGDVPAQIYDIDRDGYNEFLCIMDGSFCVFDGKTGELKRRFELPDQYAHDGFAIADLEGVGYAKNIILKNKFHQLWALDQNFNVIWTYKGNIGRYPVVCDINGDGRDEIIAGNVVLDSEGNLLWEISGEDFPECIYAGDVGLSNEPVIFAGGKGANVYSADGSIKWAINSDAMIQSASFGNIRTDNFGMEIAGFFRDTPDSEYTNGIYLTDYHGNTLFKEKRTAYTDEEDVQCIYNFEGNRYENILVSSIDKKYIYDGYMNPLYVIEKEGKVFWADILGDSQSQVIIYNERDIEIFANDETDITKPLVATPRPQSRRLYNYTDYCYRAMDNAKYAIGYVTGQFATPDIELWAENCAAEDNEEIVKRADFCVLLVSVLGILSYSNETFFDVSKNDYFYSAVSTLKDMGYIDDIVGKFSPQAPVTAEFAIDIVQKAAGFTPLTTKSGEDEMTCRDIAKITIQIIQNIKESVKGGF